MLVEQFGVGEHIAIHRARHPWECARCGFSASLAKFITWFQRRGELSIKHCECKSCGHRFRIVDAD